MSYEFFLKSIAESFPYEYWPSVSPVEAAFGSCLLLAFHWPVPAENLCAHPLRALKLVATLGLKGGRLKGRRRWAPLWFQCLGVVVGWSRPGRRPAAGAVGVAPAAAPLAWSAGLRAPPCRLAFPFRRSPGPNPASRPGSGVRRGPCVPPAPSPSPVPSPCAAGSPVSGRRPAPCVSRGRRAALAAPGPFRRRGGADGASRPAAAAGRSRCAAGTPAMPAAGPTRPFT